MTSVKEINGTTLYTKYAKKNKICQTSQTFQDCLNETFMMQSLEICRCLPFELWVRTSKVSTSSEKCISSMATEVLFKSKDFQRHICQGSVVPIRMYNSINFCDQNLRRSISTSLQICKKIKDNVKNTYKCFSTSQRPKLRILK